ncbi:MULTISPECIES: MBL fold metallo-hydrolase [Roseobacteraceae]|jgi:glyoxylase-like metal-dependent hydrolase (beta-lactamase superfamily II)|uniref:Beta-lactamase hydrolase-like protein n=1 Tax=Pseudosulfitobacter pseudonitzschiae TaxID=1402135 RepID=A0A221JYR0_9RHOB|nr:MULTISPECIES: MBL fold metallo-hydrolase [Roseobacteraceae]ASM71882.1 beta-lactamase hydrolase-like protein [Pseudosulfitobacter pseudonitzschiae]
MKFARTSASSGAGSPDVTGFYDDATGSIQYLVSDPSTRKAALIDIVLGFRPQSASTDPDSVDAILRFAEHEELEIEWILDTHPHADHLMASSLLKERLNKPNAIGEKVIEIAELWRGHYNMPDAFDPRADFDHLFQNADQFEIGDLPVRVILSPGHTLGSISYVVGTDAAFVHDTFMQPDVGTSRADFPGGSAATLYDSLQTILQLPDHTRLFIGHDYGTDNRPGPAWESTVLEQRRHNAHIGGGTSKQAFVKQREARDKTLALPDRMLHVLQMNLRAGRLPDPEDDGRHYLKIPMNTF